MKFKQHLVTEDDANRFVRRYIDLDVNWPTTSSKGDTLYIGSDNVTLKDISLPIPAIIDYKKLNCGWCREVYFLKSCKLESLHGIHEFITKISLDRPEHNAQGGWMNFQCLVSSHVLGLLLIPGFKQVSFGHVKAAGKYSASMTASLLEAVLEDHASKGEDGLIDAQHDMITAGLDDYAQL